MGPEARSHAFLTVVIALAIATLAGMLGDHTRTTGGFDILDEGAHYDYVTQLAQGHVPAWGDHLTQQTLWVGTCLGAGGQAAACTVEYRDPTRYADKGYSYEAQQPPLGYVPYLVAYDLSGHQPRDSLYGARLGGWFWIFASALLLAGIGVVEGLGLLAFSVLCTCSLLPPPFVHAAATVNNDAAGVAAGAASCLLVAVARRRGKPMLVFALVLGIVIGLVKGLFFLVPLALVIAEVLVQRPWTGSKPLRRLRSELGTSLMMLIGVAASYLAWDVIQEARARTPSSAVLHPLLDFSHTNTFHITTAFTGLQAMIPLFEPYSGNTALWSFWDIAVVGSLIGILTIARRADVGVASIALTWGVILSLAGLALAWPILGYVQGHFNLVSTTRYGIPLLPVIGLLLARNLRRNALIVVGLVLPAIAIIGQVASPGT